MPTVKIPGIGPVEKKWVYIGGAFVVGIVGYAYWNKSRADAAESEVSDYTEGPGYAMDSGVDEYVNPGGSQAPVEEDYVTAPTTNPQWAQKAIAILVDTGYDPTEASLAVGRYMLRQDLSSKQANMIRAASAQLGPPPVGSYPITITPDTPPTTIGAVTGFRVTNTERNKVRVQWDKTPNAIGYLLYKSGQASATSHALDTDAFIYFLKPNTTYQFSIQAVGVGFVKGPLTTISAKTKK